MGGQTYPTIPTEHINHLYNVRRTVKNEKMGERQYKLSLSVHELLGNHDTDLTKIAHPPNGPTVIGLY